MASGWRGSIEVWLFLGEDRQISAAVPANAFYDKLRDCILDANLADSSS